MKLGIGTAQFGLNYGIKNNLGKLDLKESKRIIKYAKKMGIDTIDTAVAYGNAHEVLSQIDTNDFKIISKLPHLKKKIQANSITQIFHDSLHNLNCEKIYAFMFHASEDLLSQNSSSFYKEMKIIKDEGFVKKIGVSIYNPNDLKMILNHFDIDIIQAPLNVFDTRILDMINSTNFRNKNIEVHVRSVFLQGLLLMDVEDIPEIFIKWKSHFKKWDKFNIKNDQSKIETAIGFAKNINSVDKIIVGVDSLSQLKQINSAYHSSQAINCDRSLSIDDLNLINPTNWNI